MIKQGKEGIVDDTKRGRGAFIYMTILTVIALINGIYS